MIHLFDGNNVMLRAMSKPQLGAARPMSLRMRYEQTQPNHIWCWDGKGHNEMRQAIYPRYKTNREPMAENLFAQIRLWRDVLKHSEGLQVESEGWEADDIIATMARQFLAKGHPVTIHSNDMDYAQITGATLNGVNTKGIPPRWVPLYKAFCGDSSDYIAGVPNFGPKRWAAMEDHWPQMERAVRAGDPAGFEGLPFTKGVAAWLSVQENVDLLQAMLTVTHFFTVPEDELNGGIIFGKPNRAAMNDLLGKFFL